MPFSLSQIPFGFIAQYIVYKEARNTFPLSEIIFDSFLILNSYVALLSLILADEAFLAQNFMSVEKISWLDIRPGYKQLPLHLKPENANIPVFRRSIKMLYK